MRRFPRQRRMGNSIIISRVSNGWTVEVPMGYDDPYDGINGEIQQGMAQVMPFIRQAIAEIHKDPLLSKLQEDQEEEKEELLQEPDTEPVEKIGLQPNLYIFQTMEEVLFFLSEEFPD